MKTLNLCTAMWWFYTVMLSMNLVEGLINSHTFPPCKQHRQSHKIAKHMSNYWSNNMTCENKDNMNLINILRSYNERPNKVLHINQKRTIITV